MVEIGHVKKSHGKCIPCFVLFPSPKSFKTITAYVKINSI